MFQFGEEEEDGQCTLLNRNALSLWSADCSAGLVVNAALQQYSALLAIQNGEYLFKTGLFELL